MDGVRRSGDSFHCSLSIPALHLPTLVAHPSLLPIFLCLACPFHLCYTWAGPSIPALYFPTLGAAHPSLRLISDMAHPSLCLIFLRSAQSTPHLPHHDLCLYCCWPSLTTTDHQGATDENPQVQFRQAREVVVGEFWEVGNHRSNNFTVFQVAWSLTGTPWIEDTLINISRPSLNGTPWIEDTLINSTCHL